MITSLIIIEGKSSKYEGGRVVVLNATFNNISVISWWTVMDIVYANLNGNNKSSTKILQLDCLTIF